MKRYMVAASALLLGTSALAVAAGADKTDKPMVEPVAAAAAAQPIADQPIAAESDLTLGEKAQMQLAMLDKAGEKPVLDETASVDKVDKTATGMGGPIEQADAGAIADLTPRPATQNYPACDPGPGDDHCIQLYEPGVRAQLAGWNRPTGGLADGTATTAMGGPYEPVDEAAKVETASADIDSDASADVGMNGDVAVDPAPGATSDTELAAHGELQGVGGPVEAQSGYPPCDPGPGDDRCIQLYERGVTGAGN